MGNVSRPLIALLVATVAFFALWVVALKPGSGSSGTSSQPSLNSYRSDINAAKNVQKTVNGNTARQSAAESGGSASSSSAPAAPATSKPATPARHTHHSAVHSAAAAGVRHRSHVTPAAHRSQTTHNRQARHPAQRAHHARTIANPGVAPTPTARLAAAKGALTQHKVLALLFYNSAAPDDRAVKQELSTVPTRHGQVVKLAVPLSEIPSYASLLAQVPVNFSPTLVIIDRHHQASAITGFADSFEIARRIDDAL